MGQRFKTVLLADTDPNTVARHLESGDFYSDRGGAKILEHPWVSNEFVDRVETHLAVPARIVWAGQYAAPDHDGTNLFDKTGPHTKLTPRRRIPLRHFAIDHDQRLYVDKTTIPLSRLGLAMHPPCHY